MTHSKPTAKKNILVTTIGRSWAIVPELLSFTDFPSLNVYENHPHKEYLRHIREEYAIPGITDIWIITTEDTGAHNALESVKKWLDKTFPKIRLKTFILAGIDDLVNSEHILKMRALIYQVVLHAAEACNDGRLLLSLTGGRKTMSADMQQAGYLFGCHALLHVIDNPQLATHDFFKNFNFDKAIPAAYAGAFTPVVISGALKKNKILEYQPAINAKQFPLDEEHIPDKRLLWEVDKRLSKARNVGYNFELTLSQRDLKQTNYRALFGLSPESIRFLRDDKIGVLPENKEKELTWLRRLPKAELHCHFGGILNAVEMIDVALANKKSVEKYRRENKEFDHMLRDVRQNVINGRLDVLIQTYPVLRDIRSADRFNGKIKEPAVAAGFIMMFEGYASLLDRFIFGKYVEADAFRGIGIERYEALGDLQGSALMQSEESLRAACRILIKQCERENIRYLELRQSPVKYTRGGLSARRVTEVIREELSRAERTVFKALFIASRHGKRSEIRQHIELVEELIDDDPEYRNWIVGFDLAGAEHACKPGELRKDFMPLLKDSMNITIHAGETEDVSNIWEAVYELNADRIGHGLTLNSNERLKNRFLNRKISIEMCPSSNDQIVGFDNSQNIYPLHHYLKEGLRVTVNTDNPGISRTNLSTELYKAARMTPDGLSRWEILQLLRNAFRGAFSSYDIRQRLLLDSEKEIVELLRESGM